jgi:hypothetical protein
MIKLIVGLFFLSIQFAHAQRLVSQVVGQAGDAVTTIRDVQINHFIETILFSDSPTLKSLSLGTSDPNFDKEVTRVLMELVVVKEAKNFNATEAPEEDINKSIHLIKQAVAKEGVSANWGKLAVSNNELRDQVAQKLLSKKFIQFKTRASLVPVTDAVALQYYQKNRGRFGQAPFTQFRESIKSFLSQEQSNIRIREWFELLQRKYRVKRIGVQRTASTSN